MPLLGIIGGTGLSRLGELEQVRKQAMQTPFGEPSSPLTFGQLNGTDVVFLARHGYGHTIPPHKVNYRANIWALHHVGVENVLAIAAVGSIREDMHPGSLVFPDQIIDYTWGRNTTFFDQDLSSVTHIDFTQPYSSSIRTWLLKAAACCHFDVIDHGVYGCMQGPRLETAAEIQRMKRDGCDMVGMTGMPEAALARELNLEYACCAVIANWAAGLGDGIITIQEIERHVKTGMEKVDHLIHGLMDELKKSPSSDGSTPRG